MGSTLRQGQLLSDSIQINENVGITFKIQGQSKKLKTVLGINVGLSLLKKTFNILLSNMKNRNDNGFPEYISSEDNLMNFKYALIALVEVVCFSKYKEILSSNRRSINFENIN